MLESLRKRGYAGDAVVLTDREHAFPAALDARAAVVDADPKSVLMKAELPRALDASCYDVILFADSDVVFLREPAPLFALAKSRLAVSAYRIPLLHNSYNLASFTEPEKRSPRTDDHSINTGLIAFPGPLFAEAAARWSEKWKTTRRPRPPELRGGSQLYLEPDQPPMQALLANWELEYDPIPAELTLMPTFYLEPGSMGPETVALHLCGNERSTHGKSGLAALMREFNALDRYEDLKAVCDRVQTLAHKRFDAPPGNRERRRRPPVGSAGNNSSPWTGWK